MGLACADTVWVALQGAQVLSWITAGEEQLFLSPLAAHDGHTPIRGGIPVCFPQFNQRGPLVKHGFARSMRWQADVGELQPLAGDGLRLVLRLADDHGTRAVWPHAFEAEVELELYPGRLSVTLAVRNTSHSALSFTTALHSYLRVPDVQQARLHGLEGLEYWDAVADTHPRQAGALGFGPEVDCVYPRPDQGMLLHRPGQGVLHIAQDPGFAQTVVWNPGPELCAGLADMQPDGWRRMLCVEAAAIDQPQVLAAGEVWRGGQYLSTP